MPEYLNLGKLPPQAVDAEQLVLGALMLESNTKDEYIVLLKPDFFYRESNQQIFRAIEQLNNSGNAVDIITVTEQLKKNGTLEEVGGSYYLIGLTQPISSTANIETHIRYVTEKFIQREIIRGCNELIKDCYENTSDLFETIEKFDSFNSQINQYLISKDYESNYKDQIEETYLDIINQSQKGFSGIDTGNLKLNAITGGWNSPDFIILCGRPGMGKSTRMLSFIKKACLNQKKCAIFSLEMSSTQLIKKQLSEQSDIFSNKVNESALDEEEQYKLKSAKDYLKSYDIYLNEKGSITPNYIRQICRERKKKYGLDIIFIDYLQLMNPNDKVKGETDESKISKVSTSLKTLAKELQVPIMAVCSLNRDLEKRSDKRPIKSDLRLSGQLEYDADMILGIYRPSQYYEFENDPDYKDRSNPDEYESISELIVMKNRHGKSELKIEERFYGAVSKFEEKTVY